MRNVGQDEQDLQDCAIYPVDPVSRCLWTRQWSLPDGPEGTDVSDCWREPRAATHDHDPEYAGRPGALAGRHQRATDAAPGRLRPRRPNEDREGPGPVRGRRAPRPDPRQPDRG